MSVDRRCRSPAPATQQRTPGEARVSGRDVANGLLSGSLGNAEQRHPASLRHGPVLAASLLMDAVMPSPRGGRCP
jgi:hypothetical protein